ncbi:MAG: malto-oligosyltrehalose synthase [Rudaea sp.]
MTFARTPTVPLPPDAIPRATYRVQLHRDFTFADVTALVPYLAALGISHLYCSPYLRARPGSLHGYDIVDHRMLNPEIGSMEDFTRMVEALSRHGMRHLCDVVPNHMAIMGEDNAWWMDVLENGPSSAYAPYFDIDWSPYDPDLAGKVLVPVLGEPYGAVLARAELVLGFEPASGELAVRYFGHRFPLDPSTYAPILEDALRDARAGSDAEGALTLARLASAFGALPSRDESAPERILERRRATGELKRALAEHVAASPSVAKALTHAVRRINGEADATSSRDELHGLLEAQAYRLAYWRVASDEINYRRFFDVNELAALRMEDPAVLEATHAFILELAARGDVGGLRIDHPDGLFDPARYFADLQRRYREHVAHREGGHADAPGIYVVIEKIAAPHERLPEAWPVHGTTGYRFANLVNGLFVDPRARARLDRAWRAFVGGEAQTFEQAAYGGRRLMMERALASELTVLTLRALRIARADRGTRDFTFNALREAIKEIVAHFPVYRTYVDVGGASAQDRRYIDWAVARARSRDRASEARIYDFLHALLLGAPPDHAPRDAVQAYRVFAMRFQQFSAPVAAKGVEDTAFYRFNRLVALNEVGGDPEQFGMTVRAFHGASADRARAWPHTMLATSTHDNKRSEDVRARIDVISEVPAGWRALVRRWSRMHRGRKREVDGQSAPSRNDEYLLYQTLVGTFPPGASDAAALDAYRARIERYMIKAAREAKVHTSWLVANAAYEGALSAFVEALLRPSPANPFLEELRVHCATFAWYGMLNSLSMTLLKLASPGVPDVYQGTEMLEWSLVDPDNRRPVDYALRRAALASVAGRPAHPEDARGLFASPYDGRAKLWVVARALALRREHPEVFADGDYRRLDATGAHAGHVVAFARTTAEEGLVLIAGRLFASLVAVGDLPIGEAWGDTTVQIPSLPSGAELANVLTGEAFALAAPALPLARALNAFPGALLHYSARAAPGQGAPARAYAAGQGARKNATRTKEKRWSNC